MATTITCASASTTDRLLTVAISDMFSLAALLDGMARPGPVNAPRQGYKHGRAAAPTRQTCKNMPGNETEMDYSDRNAAASAMAIK